MDKDRETWLAMKEAAIKKHAAGEALTLEETATAMWNPEIENQPMSAMGILKIERRALEKLKKKLSEFGITSLDDIFDPKFREYAKPVSNVYGH